MTLDALIMLLGAFVALLPFLGFPNSWDRIIFLVVGILIVALGIAVRRGKGRTKTSVRESATYVERSPLDTHDAS